LHSFGLVCIPLPWIVLYQLAIFCQQQQQHERQQQEAEAKCEEDVAREK
jgi:hypothetical protein